MCNDQTWRQVSVCVCSRTHPEPFLVLVRNGINTSVVCDDCNDYTILDIHRYIVLIFP